VAKHKVKLGRPPLAAVAASEIVKLRVTPDERRAWEQRARHDAITLSEWIRERCNR
jgi:mobilization protein NikA